MSRGIVKWVPLEIDEGLDLGTEIGSSYKSDRKLEKDHCVVLQVADLWKSTKGEGVRIAMLDSGIADVPGLLGPDARFLDHEGTSMGPEDREGHGTKCGSLIASRDKRAPGVAPNATLISICIADPGGEPDEDRVVEALATAMRLECDVVSCSFVFEKEWQPLLDATCKVIERGIVVVGAAGNVAGVANPFPEKTPGVVVVGALDVKGRPIKEQRLSPFTDVFAPGEHLKCINHRGEVHSFWGTSGATALVSGVVALILSTCAGSKRRKVAAKMGDLIRRTAKDISSSDNVKAGRIDGMAMLASL